MHSPTRPIMFDFDPEHPVELAQIRNFDVLMKPTLEVLNDGEGCAGDGAVIHMDRDDDTHLLVLVAFEENGLVNLALGESKGIEDADKLLVPASPCLLKPIQGLEEAQNAARVVLTITRWVAHVEHFIRLKFSIQVCTLDVHLMQPPTHPIRQCDNDP